MSMAPALHLIESPDQGHEQPGEAVGPDLLAQVVATPPALPWEQARMARLEAAGSAPLPLSEVVFQLVRLDPWRPGRAGRFAAVYGRTSEMGARLSATVEVDGREVQVTFLPYRERARRTRKLLFVGAGAAAAVFVLVTSVGAALAIRGEAEARLTQMESLADDRMRALSAGRRLALQARALRSEDLEGRRVDDFLRDLAWASSKRNPASQVRAFYWDAGAMVLEARGEEPPFLNPGREVRRSEEPTKPGVWLWGVEPERGR